MAYTYLSIVQVEHDIMKMMAFIFCIVLTVHSHSLLAQDINDRNWTKDIQAGHDRIQNAITNVKVSLRQIRSYGSHPGVEGYTWWIDDKSYKRHGLRIATNIDRSISIDHEAMGKNPGSVWCITPEYEFGLNRPTADSTSLKLLETSIHKDELKYYQHRVGYELFPTVWTSLSMHEIPISAMLASPPDGSYFIPPNDMPEVAVPQFEKLQSGLIRMTLSIKYEYTKQHRRTMVEILQLIADMDPQKNFRIQHSESVAKNTKLVHDKVEYRTWMRLVQEHEYDDNCSIYIPKRLLVSLYDSKTQEGLKNAIPIIDEYIFDKVETGVVTSADFRIEPYKLPASLIEQDPLPPPAAWWWPWLCGLLGVNALLGLVWWGKRRRERFV